MTKRNSIENSLEQRKFYFLIKRIFDILFSFIMIIPLFLLMILIKSIFILTGDFKSIFYAHTRIGKDGKTFKLYKFRSMIANAEEELEIVLDNGKFSEEWNKYQKLEDDPRITKIGKILRKTSIDEFPQFINVLLGDMSIVGPRPLAKGELEYHNGDEIYQKVKPGITGWWACNGRNDIDYSKRLEFEYYYVKNCSLSLDIKVLFKTIPCVFSGKGAR